MRSLIHSTRIRISDERPIKERVKDTVEGMVEEPVSHRGFVDMAGFGVGDTKGVILSMYIRFGHQVTMESQNVIHEAELKLLYIFFLCFPSLELLPGFKEIFGRNDIMVSGS